MERERDGGGETEREIVIKKVIYMSKMRKKHGEDQFKETVERRRKKKEKR